MVGDVSMASRTSPTARFRPTAAPRRESPSFAEMGLRQALPRGASCTVRRRATPRPRCQCIAAAARQRAWSRRGASRCTRGDLPHARRTPRRTGVDQSLFFNMPTLDGRARILRRGEEDDSAYLSFTPAERIGMVWPLTQQVWALMAAARGEPFDAECRLQRDHICVQQRQR